MKPPNEETWEELKLYDKCTCKDYEWEITICPYVADIYDENIECNCCPYHQQRCGDDI